MKKKVLIHSIVFAPDAVSTAYLYNDIANNLKNKGLDVEVLTTTPHYNILEKPALKKKYWGLYYTSNYNGINVIHVPQKKYNSTLLRGVLMIYWHILSIFLGLRIKGIDLIISPSPPLTIALVSILLARLKGAKFIYNVQEIYPDFFVNQGKMKSKIVIRILKSFERFVYKYSDGIVTIDENFKRIISQRTSHSEKIVVIPNFVDTDLYHPIHNPQLDKSVFPENNKLKLMYAGNIGFAQDWTPLIELAKNTLEVPIEYFVIGDGACKNMLKTSIENYALKNVHLIDYQPRETIPQIINYADIHFIFMDKKLEKDGLPSKVYTIMACKKPLLVMSGKTTPLYELFNDTGAAFLLENKGQESILQIEKILHEAMADPSILQMMGEVGYNLVQQDYSKEKITDKYYQYMLKLINR